VFAYQLRLAWKSLRRNPGLSILSVVGIGLGIGVATTFVTTYYMLSGNPIPQKADRLFFVQLDSWDPERGFDRDRPEAIPDQITYRDMVEIMKSKIPTHAGGAFKADLTVHPAGDGQKPFRQIVRMCFADFFPMFDVPFQFGSGWDAHADAGPEAVIVLDDAINRKLFGGENSVGRTLRIESREFRIVGVLAPWLPLPKFYDVTNDAFEAPEAIYMPFDFLRALEITTAGNTSSWGNGGDGFAAFLQSEAVWIQMWVQLDDEEQVRSYRAFLDAYAGEQKKLGRFQRPLNNRLSPVMTMLKDQGAVPDEAVSVLIISLLFLVVCSVNLIGVLLGKFLARAPEVGVRRALGASRRWVFVQHLLECEMIAVLGAMLGLGLAALGLEWLNRMFEAEFTFRLDLPMVGAGVLLALASGLVAGIYPAYRICRIAPAMYLKTQ
jgi:putative ABC transport system permease protein